ncbi:hypothetical protein HMI56_004350, partial [Coelomomyces lativittatus]
IYPLDTIKTRLQNQVIIKTGNTFNPQFKGVIDCARQIILREGYRGLYRGLSANLVGITPEKAIKLAVNDRAREWLAGSNSPDQLPMIQGMMAGALAGTCHSIATCPMEMTKIQMQMAMATPSATPVSLLHVVRQLGLRGMYRGTAATLLRDIPFSIVFFPSHAFFKSLLASKQGDVHIFSVFVSGILAGTVAATTVTPADVIKTRLQTDAAKYTSIPQCFKSIWVNEGPKAFFKGVTPRCLIISPLFGISLLVYEAQQRYLRKF